MITCFEVNTVNTNCQGFIELFSSQFKTEILLLDVLDVLNIVNY